MTSNEPPVAGNRSAEMWGRYWKGGVLHSCACAFRGNYQGATAAFWNAQFARLADNTTVVDVGTGNGAIPLLAKAAADEKGFHFDIHGVDLAEIDPKTAIGDGDQQFAGIEFHPRTSLTALPFADGSVDLVTSQFATEYAPIDAAIAEIARVIGARGRAAFVLHARDSVILATTAGQLESCRLLFDKSEFYPQARALAVMLAAAKTPEQRSALTRNPRADAARRRFNQSAQALSDHAAKVQTPDLLRLAMGQVSEALRAAPNWGEARCLEALQASESALRDEWLRLLDLDAAALSDVDAERLRQRFVDLGYGASVLGRLDHAPGMGLGWTLCVER